MLLFEKFRFENLPKNPHQYLLVSFLLPHKNSTLVVYQYGLNRSKIFYMGSYMYIRKEF